MTHEEFLSSIRSELGRIPPPSSRDALGNLIRSKGYSIELSLACFPVNSELFRKIVFQEIPIEMSNSGDLYKLEVPEDERT